MTSYPKFHGLEGECATNFCDEFELTCLLANQDDEQKCKMFPYLLRAAARQWLHGMDEETRWAWLRLKDAFLDEFDQKEDVQQLLETLQMHQQGDLQGYEAYEESFLHYLSRLDQSLAEEEKLPDMVVNNSLLTAFPGSCKRRWFAKNRALLKKLCG